jgi:hypothetical protein
VIWVSREAEYFLKWDWTGQIMLKRFNKFRRARKSITPVGVADYAFGSICPTALIVGRAIRRDHWRNGSAQTAAFAFTHTGTVICQRVLKREPPLEVDDISH